MARRATRCDSCVMCVLPKAEGWEAGGRASSFHHTQAPHFHLSLSHAHARMQKADTRARPDRKAGCSRKRTHSPRPRTDT